MISLSNVQASNSILNSVTGHQFNITVNSPPPPEYVPPGRINDAPIDLLADNFIGRQNLDFLFQVFGAQNVMTEGDAPTRCAIHGMPGLGKTELVLRFAQDVFSQLLYSHIFWMSAATPDKLIKGMTKILDLVEHSGRIRPEQDAKVTAARLWLEDSQRINGIRWLLILDNVDGSSLEFLREHLPRRNLKGNILFTTRASDVAHALVRVAGRRHSTLELGVPNLEETTHLLFSGAGIDAGTVTPMQKNQAEELVRNLGCLPLAVVQAASYMRHSEMTLDKMLQVSKGERKIEMIEWEVGPATDQQRSVMATFDTLFHQLERDFPESYNILRVLSFLDPEDIPMAMLTDGARMSSPLLDKPPPGNPQRESSMIARVAKWTRNRLPSQHHSLNNSRKPSNPIDSLPELRILVSLILSPIAFPKALYKLRSLSLVERLSRDGEPSLRMHDLVHFITRERAKRHGAYQAWLESAIFLVCTAFQRVEAPTLSEWWPECEKFMPHIRSLGDVWMGVEGVNVDLLSADVRFARYLRSRGRYDDAERLCERCVRGFQMGLGDKHEDTLSASYILAQIYSNQGRLTDATEAFKRVLVVRKKEFGPDHRDTLATMNGLALVYHEQGRRKEAKQLFKRVLTVREKNLGLEHLDTLMVMHNLAGVYYSQQRYDEAEELYKHVLSHREKHLGPDHVDTLATAHNLASIYLSQTKYINAEVLFARVLVGRDKQLGPSHPLTLTTAARLARLYTLQARNREAEGLYLRAFTGMTQQLRADHPDTLLCAKDFAAFYRSQGRDREADALLGLTQG